METCIFCNIVAGTLPSYKIYEDDSFLGFLDINPRTKGHALLIPKKHFTWVYDVPNFAEYWQAALKLTEAIQTALSPYFVTYVTHGLEIPHAHIHIMPRKPHETAFVPTSITVSPEELEEIAQKIRAVKA